VDTERLGGVSPRRGERLATHVHGGGRGVGGAFAVVLVVADACVVAPVARVDPGGYEHVVDLAAVGDTRVAAPVARGRVVGGEAGAYVPAGWADSPAAHGPALGTEVEAGDLVTVAADVVGGAGRDLGERLAGRARVLPNLRVIFGVARGGLL